MPAAARTSSGSSGATRPASRSEATTAAMVIIDAGTGIRELGLELARCREAPREYHVLITHYHYDHLQGLPFFDPILREGQQGDLLQPDRPDGEVYSRTDEGALFPGGHGSAARRRGVPRARGSRRARSRECGVLAQDEAPRRCLFLPLFAAATGRSSSRPTPRSPRRSSRTTQENRAYFQGADLLILDSQYTLQESLNKMDWGHTSYSLAVGPGRAVGHRDAGALPPRAAVPGQEGVRDAAVGQLVRRAPGAQRTRGSCWRSRERS